MQLRSYQGVSLRTMYRQLEHSGPCVMIVEDNGNLKTQLSKPEKEIEKGNLTYLNVNACLHYDHYVHIRTNYYIFIFCFCQRHFHYPMQSRSLYELQRCDGKFSSSTCAWDAVNIREQRSLAGFLQLHLRSLPQRGFEAFE